MRQFVLRATLALAGFPSPRIRHTHALLRFALPLLHCAVRALTSCESVLGLEIRELAHRQRLRKDLTVEGGGVDVEPKVRVETLVCTVGECVRFGVAGPGRPFDMRLDELLLHERGYFDDDR